MKCLNCQSPLGGREWLCYSCHSDGVEVDDVIDVDEEIRSRVERYFIVASVRCSGCGELHGSVSMDGEEYTAEAFGIDTVEEWELEMDKEEEWMQENRDEVLFALADLRGDWPESVSAAKTVVL